LAGYVSRGRFSGEREGAFPEKPSGEPVLSAACDVALKGMLEGVCRLFTSKVTHVFWFSAHSSSEFHELADAEWRRNVYHSRPKRSTPTAEHAANQAEPAGEQTCPGRFQKNRNPRCGREQMAFVRAARLVQPGLCFFGNAAGRVAARSLSQLNLFESIRSMVWCCHMSCWEAVSWCLRTCFSRSHGCRRLSGIEM
jgi:hypothetical protein